MSFMKTTSRERTGRKLTENTTSYFLDATEGRIKRSHLKTVDKIFEVLELIQTWRMEHPVLIQHLVHHEVHKSDLLCKKVNIIASTIMSRI